MDLLPTLFLCTCSLVTAAPLPLAQGSLAALVEDTPAATIVRGFPVQAADLPPRGKEIEFLADSAPLAVLRIEWLNQEPAPKDLHVAVTDERRVITSTHRLGNTGITRTILATPDAIFLHFVADQPGAISFKATLGSPQDGKTLVQDRSELLWGSANEGPAKVYVRVVAFESDVEAEGNSIVLRGEGECMVLFSFTPVDDPRKPISGAWKRLAEALDPGAEHPDAVKIWQAISSRRDAR